MPQASTEHCLSINQRTIIPLSWSTSNVVDHGGDSPSLEMSGYGVVTHRCARLVFRLSLCRSALCSSDIKVSVKRSPLRVGAVGDERADSETRD